MATKVDVTKLTPSQQAALAFIKAKDKGLRDIGAPVGGVAQSVTLPPSDAGLWAAYAYCERVHGMTPTSVGKTGVAIWSLAGLKAGIPIHATGMSSPKGNVATIENIAPFSQADFTEQDWATGELLAAARSQAE